MKLRKYAVSGTKDWTPIYKFWTEDAAKRFYRENRDRTTAVFKWEADRKHWWLIYPYELIGSLQAEHRRAKRS